MPESEIKQESSSSLTLPLLIVRSLVVFPSVSENIEASRDFSVKSIELAQSETNNQIVIVSQKDENIDNPEFKDIYDVGTLCKIVSSTSSDSRVKIRVVGSKRVKITSIVNKDGAFFGTFEFGESYEENVLNEVDLVKKIVDFISSNPSIAHSIPRSSLSQLGKGISPSELPDTIASFLPLNNSQRQRILNQFDPENRLKELLAILNEIKSSAEIEADLQNKVRVSAEKSQKEYFLREKMKAIRQELGESSDAASSEDKVKEKLEKNPYPENVKAKIKSELKRYEMMPEASLESSLIMSYIETLLSVPWFEKTEDDMDLDHVKKVLDEDHFGLEKVKKRIIEYLAVKKMTGNLKAPILCFYGPPGCGKTSLGRSIAKALGRKFFKTALGGISDEAEIRGHRRTYVGSMPGRIIHGMIKTGVTNPVFLLDEIDKVGGSNYRGDPSSAMLEVLDPEQNFAFNDNYIEEPYDLSNVLFICTANYIENVPAPLRDRLELIEVPSYTELEKIKIADGFLIPKQTKANGLNKEDILFKEASIKTMIEHYSMEAGVRQLERLVSSCCRKAVVEILTTKDIKKPIIIDNEKVHKYLGVEVFEGSKKEKEPQIGVVTGLAYTEFGGDILPIEVTYFKGKGGLVLTGKLGEVMKESATIALDYVRANAKKYGIDEDIFQNNDIHIHVPEGAVPKDGPSAGIALTCAIISSLTHKAVSPNIAMTGEVTLRGKALPIGGLREKSLAASRCGIKEILVPFDNKKDVEELPKEVKKSLKITFMKCVDDALKRIFIEPKHD
ncbi:MAG TPA: endopeptidase La [Firmicutes bacterium]|nr:endopeptidase La [Bacillota bacterium]